MHMQEPSRTLEVQTLAITTYVLSSSMPHASCDLHNKPYLTLIRLTMCLVLASYASSFKHRIQGREEQHLPCWCLQPFILSFDPLTRHFLARIKQPQHEE